jgi:hypothetical protein
VLYYYSRGNGRFTISRRQIRGLGTFAGASIGLGVVLLVVFVSAPTGSFVARGALSIGSIMLLGGLITAFLTLGNTRAYTEISADGVRNSGPFGKWHVAWPDVKDIKVDNMDRRDWHRIAIVCRNGRTFTLAAPFESPILVPDPDFKVKLERVVAAWRQMTVAAGN